ncbi:MAG: hypothetical protein H0X73_05020 [Chthoniobacterales bacterium]|nr:hypothetical protein [Chthoniobacterales bacterium]
MKRTPFLASLTAVAVAGTLISGCESTEALARVTKQVTTPDGGKPYVVATEKTAFFRYGPQQGSGPDQELTKDTVVNLIRSSFGFSKVQVASTGEQGFVATEDIMRAPPSVLAALTKPPAPLASVTSPRSRRESFDVRSTDPSFVPPPEDLPPPDLPPESAEPTPQ